MEYTPKFKKQVVADSKNMGISAASRAHDVSRPTIRKWAAEFEAAGVVIKPAKDAEVQTEVVSKTERVQGTKGKKGTRVHRTYTQAFKDQLIKAGSKKNANIPALAAEHDVPERTLIRWIRGY